MVQLNDKRLRNTSLAASLIVAGVVIKNSYEQMGEGDNAIAKMVGMSCFVGGWALMAMVLSDGKKNKQLYFFGASLAIIASVMAMKSYMSQGQDPPMILPLIFAGAWLVLGYFASDHLGGNQRWLGVGAAVSVLFSMLYALPRQRKMCVVDGPGSYTFMLAFVIIAYANAQR
jgi:hypothetical protein